MLNDKYSIELDDERQKHVKNKKQHFLGQLD